MKANLNGLEKNLKEQCKEERPTKEDRRRNIKYGLEVKNT